MWYQCAWVISEPTEALNISADDHKINTKRQKQKVYQPVRQSTEAARVITEAFTYLIDLK